MAEQVKDNEFQRMKNSPEMLRSILMYADLEDLYTCAIVSEKFRDVIDSDEFCRAYVKSFLGDWIQFEELPIADDQARAICRLACELATTRDNSPAKERQHWEQRPIASRNPHSVADHSDIRLVALDWFIKTVLFWVFDSRQYDKAEAFGGMVSVLIDSPKVRRWTLDVEGHTHFVGFLKIHAAFPELAWITAHDGAVVGSAFNEPYSWKGFDSCCWADTDSDYEDNFEIPASNHPRLCYTVVSYVEYEEWPNVLGINIIAYDGKTKCYLMVFENYNAILPRETLAKCEFQHSCSVAETRAICYPVIETFLKVIDSHSGSRCYCPLKERVMAESEVREFIHTYRPGDLAYTKNQACYMTGHHWKNTVKHGELTLSTL